MSNGDAAAMDFSFDIEVQVCLQHFALPFHAPNWALHFYMYIFDAPDSTYNLCNRNRL